MSARVSWEPAPRLRKRNVLEGQSALAKVLGLHASTSERILEAPHTDELHNAMVEHPEHARDIAALVKAIREHGSIIVRVEY